MGSPLYFTDCTIKEFEADVISNPTPTSAILSNTAFYPTGGGQPNDLGEIITPTGDHYNVKDVRKIDGNIIHELDKTAPVIGTRVRGIIDWKRRHTHMRMHTACHILCAVMHTGTGAKITGNQIGMEHTRIDFNLEAFDRAALEKSVEKANEIIKKGIGITFSIISQDEASIIPNLVKLEEDRSGSLHEIRVVTIEGIDIQACGGTHVGNTLEIGTIILERVDNKGKNNRRVYFTLDPKE